MQGAHQATPYRAGPRRLATLALLLSAYLALPGGLKAQRLLDWPVRTHAAPEALLDAATAAFWNPASALADAPGWGASLGSFLGPDASGLAGVVLAASRNTRSGWGATLSYLHLGIPEIPQTSTSPEPDPLAPALQIAEDRLGAALAFAPAPAIAVGLAVDVTRHDALATRRAHTGFAGGAVFSPATPGAPRLALYGRHAGGRTGGGAAIETRWAPADAAAAVVVAYGAATEGGRGEAIRHRATMTAATGPADVTLGLAALRDDGARHWLPVLAAALRLGQVELGVLREAMPNEFGAAHAFRFSVAF